MLAKSQFWMLHEALPCGALPSSWHTAHRQLRRTTKSLTLLTSLRGEGEVAGATPHSQQNGWDNGGVNPTKSLQAYELL